MSNDTKKVSPRGFPIEWIPKKIFSKWNFGKHWEYYICAYKSLRSRMDLKKRFFWVVRCNVCSDWNYNRYDHIKGVHNHKSKYNTKLRKYFNDVVRFLVNFVDTRISNSCKFIFHSIKIYSNQLRNAFQLKSFKIRNLVNPYSILTCFNHLIQIGKKPIELFPLPKKFQVKHGHSQRTCNVINAFGVFGEFSSGE